MLVDPVLYTEVLKYRKVRLIIYVILILNLSVLGLLCEIFFLR